MGFIFGGNTGETQESIKRKRDYAQALMASKGAPRDVGEGLNSLGNAIAYRMALSQIGKGEAAMAEKNSALMAPIVESFGGGAQQFPEPPASPAAPKETASYSPDGSMAGKIAETAQALGIDPVDLGTAISYETAGTFDPTKKGPTTQWGQHRGLIQFGEPQAKKYGVDWNDPVGSQLGSNGAVAKYLRDTGVKPGMGMMDIYSAINAGSVGKYGASDANNGGAPGTVADKVNSQMAGHRAKAEAMMKAIQNSGTQVASLDPAIGMASAAPAEQPQSMYVGEVGANGAISTKERPAANAIRKILGGQEQPAPVQVAQAAPQGQVSEQQVVQELFGSPAPRPQLNPGMLMQALSDPNISEQNRATLQGLLQNEMKKADPAYQAQQQMDQIGLQKAQIELERLKSGTPADPLEAQYKQMQIKKMEAEIAAAGNPKSEATAEQKNYEFAISQLRERGVPDDKLPTFQEWSKPKSRGISFTGPDGTKIQIGGDGEEGSPNLDGTSIPAEVGARIGLGQSFLDNDYPEIIKMIDAGDATGPIDWAAGKVGKGNSGIVQRRMASGVDALRRGLTGAGMSMSETEEYASRYSPQLFDNTQTLRLKAEGLKRDLEAVSSGAINGKAGNIGGLMPNVNAPSPAPTEKKRLKFNPATGELE